MRMDDYQRGGNPAQFNPAPRKRGGDGRRRADGGGYGARLKSGLFWFVILSIGVYCYLHPATLRSWLDKAGQVKIQVDGGTAPIAAGESVTPAAAIASSWGSRIAAGHAFAKHGAEFGFSSADQMAAHIDRVIASPSANRQLSSGREAYWDDATGTVVILDPNSNDGGTAFKPNSGRRYYERVR